MSTDADPVAVELLGQRRLGRLVDDVPTPKFNDPMAGFCRVEVNGHVYRVDRDDVESV